MRPLNTRESSSSSNNERRCWRVLTKYNSITQTTNEGKPLPERINGRTFFTFDRTFAEKSNTGAVYEDVAKNIVHSVMGGLNGTIFAYGQTSSGKTYTMQGGGSADRSTEGIVHMAAKDIFHHIHESTAQNRNQDHSKVYLIRVSFIEIYNEEVRDLLVTKGSGEDASLQIREDPRRGVFVDANEMIATSYDSLLDALFAGEKNRQVASTGMNERSSRSHTIFRITVESRNHSSKCQDKDDDQDRDVSMEMNDGDEQKDDDGDDDGGAVLVATLNLVDLAGSESVRHTGATGKTQKEGGKINQRCVFTASRMHIIPHSLTNCNLLYSLLTLSRVISKLGSSSSKGHINFRDSKLTRILQPSLSGNARMAVICCATPSSLYLEETRSTLQFAARAKLVKTRAQVNEILDDRAIIKRLQRELVEARRHAAAISAEGGTVTNTENVEKLKFLEEQVDTTKDAFAKAMKNVERLKGLFLRSGDFEGSNSIENIQRSKQALIARERRRKTIDNNDIMAQEAFVVDSNFFLKQDELLRVKRGNRRQSDGGVLPSYSSYKQNSSEDHVNENIDPMIFKEALAQKGDLSRKLHARKQESDAMVSDLCEQVENLKGKHDALIQRNNFVEAQIIALEADRDVVVKDKCEQIEKLSMELNKYKEYLLEEKKAKESTLSDLDELRKETSVRISDNALMEEELCRLETENTEQNTTIRKLQSNLQSRDEMIESLRNELSNQQEQNRSSLALMNDELLKQKGCNDELLSVKEKELSSCKDNLMALEVNNENLQNTLNDNKDKWEVEKSSLQENLKLKDAQLVSEKEELALKLLNFEQKMEEQKSENERLMKTIADLTTENEKCREELRLETNEKYSLEENLQAKIKESSEQSHKLDQMSESLCESSSEIHGLKENARQLTAEIERLTKEILSNEQEFLSKILDSDTKCTDLNEQLAASIASSEEDREKFLVEIKQLKETIDENSNERHLLEAEFQAKNDESSKERKNYEMDLLKLKEDLKERAILINDLENGISKLNQEQADLIDQLRESQGNLAKRSAEIETLKNEKSNAEGELHFKVEKGESQINRLTEEIDSLQRCLSKQTMEHEALSKKLSDAVCWGQDLQNQMRLSKEKESAEKISLKETLEAKIVALANERDAYRQELVELREKFDEHSNEMTSLQNELKVKITKSTDEHKKFEVEISQLRQNLDKTTAENEKFEIEIEGLEAEMATLVNDLRASQDSLKEACFEKSRNSENCARLEEQLQTTISEFSYKREELEVEISQLNEKLEEGTSTIESLRAEVSERSAEIETLRNQSANLENDLRVSQDCLKAASSEKSSIEQELLVKISDSEDKCIKLEEELQVKHSQSIDEREKFEVEISHLKEELEEGSSTIESLRSEAIERSDEIDKLNAKVTNLANDLQKSQDCLKAVSSEKCSIEQELLMKISGSDEQLQSKDLELSTEREKYEMEISQLKEKLEEGSSAMESLRSEAIEHSVEMEGLKLEILGYNEELEKLREELGHQSTENVNLLSVISNASNEREELEKKVRSLDSRLEGKASLELEMLEKSSNAEDRYNKLKDDFARVQERLHEETAKNNNLNSRVADIEKERELNKEHIAAMDNDMEDMKSQLSEAIHDRVKIKENLNVQEALKDQALCNLNEEIRKNSVMQSEVTKLESELLCALEKINKNDNEFPQYDDKIKCFQASIHEKDVHIATLEEKLKAQDQSYAQTLSTSNKQLKETEVEKLSNAFNEISEEKSSLINKLQEELDLANKKCANAEANYFDAKQGYEDVIDENSILRSKLDAAGIKQSEVVSAISIENEVLMKNLESMKNEISSATSKKEEMESCVLSLRAEIQELRQKYKFAETQAAEACRDAKFHKNEVCLRNRLVRDQEEELKDGKIIYNELLQELNELKNEDVSQITSLRDEIGKLNEIIKVKDARIKKLDATKLTSAQATVSILILFMSRNLSLI